MSGKILLVDDDIDTLRLVGMMLESEGYDIVAAKDGQRAISLAHSEAPDLIILDIMMPDLDGYAVTRQLRQDEVTKNIPILIFTAKTGMDDKMLGLELGADVYLTKPISTRELHAQVNNFLETAKGSKEEAKIQKNEGMLAIMAAKGGMGVSTLAINLGISIHRKTNEETIISDFRPGQGSLALELGYERSTSFNDLLELPSEDLNLDLISEKIIIHSTGVRLLHSSPQLGDARYESQVDNFELIAQYLPKLAPHVVLDLGPGISLLNQKVLPYCSNVVTMVEPAPQSISQTEALLAELDSLGITRDQVRLVVFNRVSSSQQLPFGQIEQQLDLKIVSAFTPNRNLSYQASRDKTPIITLMPEGLTAQQINKLAVNLI
jgi:CheY-like chemotaxis protein